MKERPASDGLPKNGLGDGGTLRSESGESSGASSARGRGLGRIPRKSGGEKARIGHDHVLDGGSGAAADRRRNAAEGRREHRGDKERRNSQKDVRCFNCRRTGHFARNCQYKKKPAEKRRRQDSDSSEGEEESIAQKKMKEAARK